MRPIKTRKAEHLTDAIASVYDILSRTGFKPRFHQLDNECPQELKEFFRLHQVKYQLSPPDNHYSNATGRAIRTAKNHLKSRMVVR